VAGDPAMTIAAFFNSLLGISPASKVGYFSLDIG
jgi:hypothetical protein